MLAWLKANRPGEFQEAVHKAVTWIGKQRGGYGGFGSTQSTILALKSLIAYTKENRKTAEAGTLQLRVNGHLFTKDFPAGVRDEIVLRVPDADNVLKPGKNQVQMEISGKNVFPYTLTWAYRTRKPGHDAAKCPVHLTTKLDRAVAKDRVRLTAVVENKSGKGQGMAVAVIGLPGGLEVPADMRELRDLARLRENGTKPGLIQRLRDQGPRIDPVLERPGPGPADRGEPGFAVHGAGRVSRAGEPGVFILQRRAQILDGAVERDD